MSERIGIGSPQERELQYYRRECNDLGSRLLRLQEEQSQAFLEARRSRTVVRLVREAYRLAEPTQANDDVGGALLQVVVENALCDRAAFLREEPPGSGRFLVAHAIGGTSLEADEAVTIPDPPAFFFTSSLRLDRPPEGLLDILRLPFILWAYDRSSGHALAIGNRQEVNVSRPFETGDQELIEAALFVYLDILYRKHAEAQLRQAKQAAEEASLAQHHSLEALSGRLRLPTEAIQILLQTLQADNCSAEQVKSAALQLAARSRELIELSNDALSLTTPNNHATHLDVQWVDLGDVVRRVFRSTYPASVKGGVDLNISLPRRKVSMCVDRDSIHRALQMVVSASLIRALPGSTVKLSAGRRGDGAVEVLVSSPIESVFTASEEPTAQNGEMVAIPLPGLASNTLAAARRIVEAHDGVLLTESRLHGGRQDRIIFPVHITRDDILLA